MATAPLKCRIVTPDSEAFSGVVKSVVVPSEDGETAFLRGHAPFIGLLGFGEARVTTEAGELRRMGVYGGLVRVLDHEVLLAAQGVESPDEIDLGDARDEREASAAALRKLPASTPEAARQIVVERHQRACARVMVGERAASSSQQ